MVFWLPAFFSRSVFPVTSNSHQNTPQQYAIGAFKSTILCFKRTTFSYSSYVCCHIRFKDVCRDRSFNSNFTVPQDQPCTPSSRVFKATWCVFNAFKTATLATRVTARQLSNTSCCRHWTTRNCSVPCIGPIFRSRPGMKTVKTIQLFEFCAGIYSTHAHILSRNGISLILYTREAMP